MNKKEKTKVEKIFNDCIKLEKKGELTEYGTGQGNLCIMLLKKRRKPFRH